MENIYAFRNAYWLLPSDVYVNFYARNLKRIILTVMQKKTEKYYNSSQYLSKFNPLNPELNPI